MAQAEFEEVLKVDAEKLYRVITQYEFYPKFVEGCQSAQVDRISSQQAKVTYHVNVLSQDVHYVLQLQESVDQSRVEWTLIESNFFKKNIGHWELKSLGPGKTQVKYSLDVEFKVPIPSFVLNRLVKGSLPGMVRSFEKRALQIS